MLDYFSVLARLNRQRKKVLGDTDNSDITRYLLRPFAELSEDLAEQRLLAIDLETTGLSPQKDHIIAIGGVEVSDGKIALATAFHHHVKANSRSAAAMSPFTASPILRCKQGCHCVKPCSI